MRHLVYFFTVLGLFGCVTQPTPDTKSSQSSYYGTLEPFASDSVYFLMTDRFVNGDKSNDYPEQGGENSTYMVPLVAEDGRKAYIGYMGGDFKGVLENADYIKDMGFSSIWLTPIVEQPDEAFTGGTPIGFGGRFQDGGKTGYHGYWGVNFYKLDEHLPSEDLDYQQLVAGLEEKGIKTVLDVVLNHGSPAYTMPIKQDLFGQIYDKQGNLIADHGNLAPDQLDHNNPLHQMYNRKKDFGELSDLNSDNPAVLDYFVGAYNQWLDQGAHVIRIDTIKHMPIDFWKRFADRMRAERPDLFMFAEAFIYEAEKLGKYTQEENGRISVLDFPMHKALLALFENSEGDYRSLIKPLYLENGPYSNPYNLMTFYDNHDMARIKTDERGFINLHNWLFTSRGIPVLYYGSEMGFMTGAFEHEGSRNYYGSKNIELAKQSNIYTHLKTINFIRKANVALQKGLQINLSFDQNLASFLRVYEHDGLNQTALVLLNKGNTTETFQVADLLSKGLWSEAVEGSKRFINKSGEHSFLVAPNSVQVWLFNDANNHQGLIAKLQQLMDK